MVDEKFYAVLTGDVVGSRRLGTDERHRLLAALTDVGERMRAEFPQSIPFTPDIFRGDSWQFVSTDPAHSLRQGLFFRASVKAGMGSARVDTRFCLGIGTIDFIPPEGPSAGAGQAFNLSGAGLDEMERRTYLSLRLPPGFDPALRETLAAVTRLIDRLAQDWTDRQSMAVSGALLAQTQEQIADAVFDEPITQQAVAQHLNRAGWPAIQVGLEAFETTISRWLRQ